MKKIIVILAAIFSCFGYITNSQAVEIDELGVEIHGFISQGYMDTDENNFLISDSERGSFEFNEIGINFSKDVSDKLRIGLQLFAHDLGEIGNSKIKVDWAFADYRWKDWLGLRAGIIKAPHGLYNETRDVDMLRTSILLPQSVYTDLNRETMKSIQGIGIYGNGSLNSMGDFSYYLLGGTMGVNGDNDNGAVRQFNSSPLMEVTDDFKFEKVYIGSLEWQTPLEGLLLKTTYRTSSLDIPGQTTIPLAGGYFPAGTPLNYGINKHSTWVHSLEYTWNDLVLAAEYQKTKSDFEINLLNPVMPFTDDVSKNHGYYLSGAYRFTDWFEAGAYYSEYYSDSDDKEGTEQLAAGSIIHDYQAWLKDTALSLRFDISDNWTFKLEGHLMDGAALILSIDNDDYEKDWHMIAAKFSFNF